MAPKQSTRSTILRIVRTAVLFQGSITYFIAESFFNFDSVIDIVLSSLTSVVIVLYFFATVKQISEFKRYEVPSAATLSKYLSFSKYDP